MDDFLKKLKENYKENKTACILLLLFILFFCIISGPEIAQETAATSVGTEEDATADAVEHETGDSAGEKLTEAEDSSENEEEAAKGSGNDSDQKNGAADESEYESELEAGVESETIAAELSGPEWERTLHCLQARYGERFQIPCVITEEDPERVVYVALPDKKKLPGYHLPEEPEMERTFETLQTMLENKIAGYDGAWSVYVKNLSTDEEVVINDQPMKSASVMKLFIMGTVYKAFESGELEQTDENKSLVKNMIIYSDNSASNELLLRLGNGSYADGIACVDAFIAEYGFSGMTVEYNGFNDPATNTGTGKYNQVAARDCGKLLEDIYRRTWVNRSVSNEIESMLLMQNTRYKIPSALPEGVLCGNKTGEMDTTENDAAIIYSDQCDYILVVLSSDWSSKDQAIGRIASISSSVYRFLNPEEEK